MLQTRKSSCNYKCEFPLPVIFPLAISCETFICPIICFTYFYNNSRIITRMSSGHHALAISKIHYKMNFVKISCCMLEIPSHQHWWRFYIVPCMNEKRTHYLDSSQSKSLLLLTFFPFHFIVLCPKECRNLSRV